MTRRIKWWAVIGIAMFIIGALLVIHYSLRIAVSRSLTSLPISLAVDHASASLLIVTGARALHVRLAAPVGPLGISRKRLDV
ncbi:hypothetical protein AC630_17105 [Bradyrhizobium sp. AS23.2]|nr:hypothetical protein AC630_17105 [Bradyrhizobium sp. AS23.2]